MLRRWLRHAAALQLLERSFWLVPGGMVAVAAVTGIGIPLLERGGALDLSAVSFDVAPSTANQIFGSIATGTISAAGVAFSVVVVALQLASQQFSPRVLQTYRRRRLSQVSLGAFLATATFSLLAMRVITASPSYVPELSLLLAMAALVASAGLFVAFVADIVRMTEVAAVIHRTAVNAGLAVDRPFPAEGGRDPADADDVAVRMRRRTEGPPREVRSPRAGFIESIDVGELVDAAADADGFVEQCVPVGEFMLTGGLLARTWAPDEAADELARRVVGATLFGEERTAARDLAFPVRQLADIAVKALSPSLNDPTTAENAMDAAAELLVRRARREAPSHVRCDDRGEPRVRAEVVDFDRLVRVAFDQPRIYGAGDPAFSVRMLRLLSQLRDAACAHRRSTTEVERQARLLRDSARTAAALPEDAEEVVASYEALFERAATTLG